MDDIAVKYNFNYIFITVINHAVVITLYNIELWEQNHVKTWITDQ